MSGINKGELTMNDTEWSNIDDKLYELLVNYFHLDFIDEKELNKYHGFRNDVIDLFIKESEQWLKNLWRQYLNTQNF